MGCCSTPTYQSSIVLPNHDTVLLHTVAGMERKKNVVTLGPLYYYHYKTTIYHMHILTTDRGGEQLPSTVVSGESPYETTVKCQREQKAFKPSENTHSKCMHQKQVIKHSIRHKRHWPTPILAVNLI